MFRSGSKTLCVDATEEDGSMGRLMNHEKRKPNVAMKVVTVNDVPRVVFFACKDIDIGHELCYDYGERRKHILQKFPWLK